jgi:hypothetical protein
VLIACFLAVFALAPAFDAVICEADEPAVAHALAGETAAVDHSHQGHTEPSGVCTHGHCHQAASEAPHGAVVTAAAQVEHQVLRPVLYSVPVSNRHFRLIRPPRA